MPTLIDTNFLLALVYTRDQNHKKALEAINVWGSSTGIVPAPVLQELFYMASVRINYGQAISLLERILNASFDIQALTEEDMRRMVEIMRQYASASFDYTDVTIMAMSERLNIQKVYTFDHRDHRIFRPKHCPYLELLP